MGYSHRPIISSLLSGTPCIGQSGAERKRRRTWSLHFAMEATRKAGLRASLVGIPAADLWRSRVRSCLASKSNCDQLGFTLHCSASVSMSTPSETDGSNSHLVSAPSYKYAEAAASPPASVCRSKVKCRWRQPDCYRLSSQGLDHSEMEATESAPQLHLVE
jgi:hypothetical protein